MSTIGTIQKTTTGTSQSGNFVLVVAKIASRLFEAAERRGTRRALLSLNDEQLKDIGLSRSQAYSEAVRPFWK